MSRLLAALTVLVALQAAPPQDAKPAAGFTLERRVRAVTRDLIGKASEIDRREIVKIQGGNVSIEDVTFRTRLIIRTDRRLAWVIDAADGTYSEVTFDAVAERRKRVLADLAEARKRVEGTQDADDIDKILIGLGEYAAPPTVEVRDTGKTEDVASRKCAGRDLVVNGTDRPITVFVDLTLSGALAYFDALAGLGGFNPAIAAKLKDLGGFPMKGEVRYALFLDRVLSREEVQSVAQGEIPAAEFELPANLKRVPLKGFDPDGGPKPEKPKNFEQSYREDDLQRERDPLRKTEKKEK